MLSWGKNAKCLEIEFGARNTIDSKSEDLVLNLADPKNMFEVVTGPQNSLTKHLTNFALAQIN